MNDRGINCHEKLTQEVLEVAATLLETKYKLRTALSTNTQTRQFMQIKFDKQVGWIHQTCSKHVTVGHTIRFKYFNLCHFYFRWSVTTLHKSESKFKSNLFSYSNNYLCKINFCSTATFLFGSANTFTFLLSLLQRPLPRTGTPRRRCREWFSLQHLCKCIKLRP